MINTSRLRLVISLMAVAAIIIIAMAIYVFTHFSTMESIAGYNPGNYRRGRPLHCHGRSGGIIEKYNLQQ